MRTAKLALLFLALLATPLLNASVEGILALEKFTVESSGIGKSGPVTVTGTQNNLGITALNVLAFGKSISVSSQDLEKLKGLTANGLQISYEEGYKNTGGKTVYVSFIKGFTSGEKKRVSVSITENGVFSVVRQNRPEEVLDLK